MIGIDIDDVVADPGPPGAPTPGRSKLLYLGFGLTAVWIVGGILWMVSFSCCTPLRANEWGDVFAGLFAPVAFLWLVLGFIQQGQELQLSTQALRLQVEELKSSVEQQRELVDVSRRQMLATLDEQERKRVAEVAAKQPRFIWSSPGWASNPQGGQTYTVEVRNVGATVTNVCFNYKLPFSEPATISATAIRSDESLRLRWDFGAGDFPGSGVMVDIHFLDVDHREGRQHFHARLVQGKAGKVFDVIRSPV